LKQIIRDIQEILKDLFKTNGQDDEESLKQAEKLREAQEFWTDVEKIETAFNQERTKKHK